MFAEQYILWMMQDKMEAEARCSTVENGGEEYPGETFAELSKDMIGRYIDKIEVYDEQHMEIRWKDK